MMDHLDTAGVVLCLAQKVLRTGLEQMKVQSTVETHVVDFHMVDNSE